MGNWLINLFRRILGMASGPIRDMLVGFASDFRAKAKETPNPWDDILADIVCWLLVVPETQETPKAEAPAERPGAAAGD